jgi:hypothetical protein
VHTPIPEFVARLNAYRPAAIVGYASVIRLLATEQEAGRLHISPVLVQPAGDAMTTRDLGTVTLERAEEPPRQEPGGGKYRTIIPLR